MTIPASSSGARSYVTAKELTLDRTDTRLISDVYDDVQLQRNTNGLLATANQSGEACAAFILSDSTTGKLHVSTETLVVGDEVTIEGFADDEQVMAAIETYGLDATTFLESGDLRRRPGTPRQRIVGVIINGQRVPSGGVVTIPVNDSLEEFTLLFALPVTEETELVITDEVSQSSFDNSKFTIEGASVSLNSAAIEEWKEGLSGEFAIPTSATYDTEVGTLETNYTLVRS